MPRVNRERLSSILGLRLQLDPAALLRGQAFWHGVLTRFHLALP